MPELTTDEILRFLAASKYRPQKVRALARSMGVDDENYAAFRECVKELMHIGRIVMGRGNALMLPQGTNELVGRYRSNPRGFGFVVPQSPDEHGDLYIPPGDGLNAITGDLVRAKIVRKGKRGDRMLHEGKIAEVLVRGNNQFVGQLQSAADRWFVRPDGNTLNVPIEIADITAKQAKAGDQVVVEITEYPRGQLPARGVIVKRLGAIGEAGVAVRSVLYQFGYEEEFPEEVLDEARRRVKTYNPEREAAGREDLRALTTFTIDPDDAKDYDDAISIQRLPKGGWELGVHIADVTAFVPLDSALDREARRRGNSVYFPGFVLPMLPEVLSNGLCSLQEGQPRLVKSAFIRIDAAGRPTSARFANAIIASKKRLTYRQAQQVLDGKTGGCPEPVVASLCEAEKLARTIRKRRLADGMLVLDLPEVELTLDKDGHVTGAEPADASFTHTLIEMFMVEANEAVARQLSGLGVPFLRRIHPEPAGETSERLAQYLRVMDVRIPKTLARPEMQTILDAARGRPEGFAVHMAILRTFEQAVYSPKVCGHFALASEDYCHFTSPIRRYPDATVHRLLDLHINGKLGSRRDRHAVTPHSELLTLGEHCSLTERRAENAEREVKKVLVLQHLEKHLGDEFDGVVTGVANVGVFVQLPQFLIDGLVRFADLPDDWWELDQKAGMLVGQRSGRRIQIGDRMRVAVAAIDIASRELNLALVKWTPRASSAASLTAQKDKAKKHKAKRPPGRRGRRRAR